MAILAFQKPENVVRLDVGLDEQSEKQAYELIGRFEFKPLEPGYGITIGNALRRILLSSLEGFAITSIRIDSVDHEFATIPGVTEDVTNIILNLKKIRFKQVVDHADEEIVSIQFPEDRNVIVAGDLNDKLVNFEVTNVDQHICSFDPSVTKGVQMELRINKGRGYVPADENRRHDDEISVIAIDSIYTPIRKVKYEVDNYRVEQKTDYEKLTLDVVTDGTVDPEVALREAAKILIEHFSLFADTAMQVEVATDSEDVVMDEETIRIRQMLEREIDSFNLSVRARNCLKSNNVFTLADLLKHSKSELIKFRNFGKKTLDELSEFLQEIGLDFDTDLSKYNLDLD